MSYIVTSGPPLKVVTAATVTGAAASAIFAVQENSNVTFQAITSGGNSAFTVNLEVSLDGGTTWNTHPNGSALDFAAAPIKLVLNLAPGCIYRLNPTTVTSGSVDVMAVAAASVPV